MYVDERLAVLYAPAATGLYHPAHTVLPFCSRPADIGVGLVAMPWDRSAPHWNHRDCPLGHPQSLDPKYGCCQWKV